MCLAPRHLTCGSLEDHSWYSLLPLQEVDYEKEYKSNSVFLGTHAALQLQFKQGQGIRISQGLGKLNEQLQDDPNYKSAWRLCKDLYNCKRGDGPLPYGRDPHEHTTESTYKLDEFVGLCVGLLKSKHYKDARDLSMLTWQSFTCGRGDDARERRLYELMEPAYRKCIGQITCMILHHLLRVPCERPLHNSATIKQVLFMCTPKSTSCPVCIGGTLLFF